MPGLLHVFDLPQLYERPRAEKLRETLTSLEIKPASFKVKDVWERSSVSEEGIPRYLTSIIGSSLGWISSETDKEEIWELASARLTERSGRTAMGDMTREFDVDISRSQTVSIRLREPALTGDNLGLKTWSSAFVLANQLHSIYSDPALRKSSSKDAERLDILELGSGTGLVGMVAAMVWASRVVLTDLPEIAPNLTHNADLNMAALIEHGATALTGVLDWREPNQLHLLNSKHSAAASTFPVIIAADPIYSPEHPALLIAAIKAWLRKDTKSTVIIAYPIREAYATNIMTLRKLLEGIGLSVTREGRKTAVDDWKDQVMVSWSVWRFV